MGLSPGCAYNINVSGALLCLFDHLGLQLHGTKSINFAINVMAIGGIGYQTNVFHLGSYLNGGGASLYFQILNHRNGIAVLQHISVGILNHSLGFFRSGG